jgi:hypothetical protein
MNTNRAVGMIACFLVSAFMIGSMAPDLVRTVRAAAQQVEDPIPDLIVAGMVRLSLEKEFADAPHGTIVYLVSDNIRPQWLPVGLAVDFRLITVRDSYAKQDAGEIYYSFTDPMKREYGYSIGLVHGLGCGSTGPSYHFELVNEELRMRPSDETVTITC